MVAVQTDIRSNLPLTEVTFFIMLSLAPRPRHGYAIMKDVRALSKGRIVLSTGTLYGALKRLLQQGWIERANSADPLQASLAHPGRPRKAYALSHLGRGILEAEIERLHTLVTAAQLSTGEVQT